MTPVLALVGRPNVGKSTLFNRLTRTRDALVANQPGLTRDRQYGQTKMGPTPAIVIDTAGITGGEEGIDAAMAEQSWTAVLECDECLFMVDAKEGLSPIDLELAQRLRREGKNVHVVVNKIDRVNMDVLEAEFSEMGFSSMYHIAASHGRGVSAMIQSILESYVQPVSDDADGEAEQEDKGIKVAVVGRPNVGKSTLINRFLGEDRVVTFDAPGTTRDSIYLPYESKGQRFTLIDTAGVRRRGKVKATVEKFSVVKSLQAMNDAHVVILVVDAREGIVDQDLHLLKYCLDVGRALVIAVNKWDGMTPDQRDTVKQTLGRRLNFIDWADIHFISALHGTGVGHLQQSVKVAFASATIKPASNALTQLLEAAVMAHQPPLVKGRRIKLRYAHLGGSCPPRIVIHGNQTSEVPGAYTKYLQNYFIAQLKLKGTPIFIEYRTGSNPFEGKKNNLTPRQQRKRQRMMKFYKSKGK